MHAALTKFDDGVIAKTLFSDESEFVVAWRLVYYPPNMRLEDHRHDVAQFSVLLSGQLREFTRCGEFDSRPMLMEFKPSRFRHSNDFGPDGALLLSIDINPGRSHFENFFPSREWRFLHCVSTQNGWTYLARSILSQSGASQDELESTTIELLSVLAQPIAEPTRAVPPAWLRRAREAVIQTDESVQAIADDAGVHRVHLCRAFRRHFDQTIGECRRQMRLARAVRFLADAGTAASTASYAAGFADQSHLTRTMRRETGMTPGVLKALFAV